MDSGGAGDEAGSQTVYVTAGHHEDALTVEEAQLSMLRRIGASE